MEPGHIKGQAPLNPRDADRAASDKKSARHDSEIQRWAYGYVLKVSPGNQVQIMSLETDTRKGFLVDGGRWISITNNLLDVAMRWGTLREGMLLRIHWAGESISRPRRVMAEVIADTFEHILNEESPRTTVNAAPWKIFIFGV